MFQSPLSRQLCVSRRVYRWERLLVRSLLFHALIAHLVLIVLLVLSSRIHVLYDSLFDFCRSGSRVGLVLGLGLASLWWLLG